MTGFRRLILLFAVASVCDAKASPCHFPGITSGDQVRMSAPVALIITHASKLFDGRLTSKPGMDRTVSYAKGQGWDVVYLLNGSSDSFFMLDDCQPDHAVSSSDGKFSFPFSASRLISAGGHWQACLNDTIESVLAQRISILKDFEIIYVMDSIYAFSHGSITPEDPYYPKVQEFLRVLNGGTSRRPDRFSKITLLEAMNLIKDKRQQAEFLLRNTPPRRLGESIESALSRIPEAYNLTLQINSDAPIPIRQNGLRPTIRFRYVNHVDCISQNCHE